MNVFLQFQISKYIYQILVKCVDKTKFMNNKISIKRNKYIYFNESPAFFYQ